MTTKHCCETTARMAGNLGFDVTHTFDRNGLDGLVIPVEEITRVTAANLHGEFATVVTTPGVIRQSWPALAGSNGLSRLSASR